MRILFPSLITAFAVAARPVGAQVVSGFAGLPWGSSPDSALAHYGTPVKNAQAPTGERWLMFRETILDRQVETYLLFTERGLIKGAYSVTFGGGNDCLDAYSNFQRAIAERYPSLNPQETRQYSSAGLDFCDAVSIGRASIQTEWEDGATPVYILVALKPEAKTLEVHYEGPGFKAWDEASRARERKDKF